MGKLSFFLCLIGTFFCTSSCQNRSLYVQERYYSHESLNSVLYDTPDPKKHQDHLGVALYIKWKLKQIHTNPNTDSLKVRTLHRDFSLETQNFPLKDSIGSIELDYPFNPQLNQKQPLAYKVEILLDNKVTHSWEHKMWIEPLSIDP